jgi:two-component system chemotaxis response regulator CheB
MNAAVFITMHLGQVKNGEHMAQRFQKNTSFICKMADDAEIIQAGYVYIAVPDKHLLIKENKIILGTGPEETAGAHLLMYFSVLLLLLITAG